MQSRTSLTAHDVWSGLALWTAPIAAATSMLVIDGRVICSGTNRLRSIDGRTGKTLWTTPVQQPGATSGLTDGMVVIVAQQAPGQQQTIAAYGLDDGELSWTADIAYGRSLFAADGRLYAEDGRRLAALG